MLRNSSGETLLHDLGSLEPSFQIMDSNLTAKPSEDIVANWGSQTGTQHQLILRETDKSRLSIKILSMGLRKDWMTPREEGRGVAPRLMDLPDHTAAVNRRDTFGHDLWGQGYYPSRGKLPNAEDELLHSKQQ